MKIYTGLLLSLLVCSAIAGPPKKRSIAGLQLGSTITEVQKWAKQNHPNCSLEFIPLRDPKDGDGSYFPAHFMIATGHPSSISKCATESSKTEPKFGDKFFISLVNKESRFADRVFQIGMHREFLLSEGPMYGGPSYTLDETIDMLVKQFGPPTFSGSTDEEDVVNKRNLSRLELEKWLARQTTIWWGESGFNKSDGSCKLPCKGVRLRAKIVTWLTPYSPGKESVVSIGLSLTDGSAEEIEDNWVDRRKAATKKTDGLRF